MDHTYWLKQTKETALFSDILWSRPESKMGAGKLLIIGGNAQAFSEPGKAFTVAQSAGAGITKVLLPDSLKRTVGQILETADYTPSTPSGSFSKLALDGFITHSTWADCSLLVGDFGRNSETAVVLEQFIKTYIGPLVLTRDALDYFRETPGLLLNRDSTVLVPTLAQLQKMVVNIPLLLPITYGMGLVQLVEALYTLTEKFIKVGIVMRYQGTFLTAHNGKVSTTPDLIKLDKWRTKTATYAAVFWMQSPQRLFESITTSLLAD